MHAEGLPVNATLKSHRPTIRMEQTGQMPSRNFQRHMYLLCTVTNYIILPPENISRLRCRRGMCKGTFWFVLVVQYYKMFISNNSIFEPIPCNGSVLQSTGFVMRKICSISVLHESTLTSMLSYTPLYCTQN